MLLKGAIAELIVKLEMSLHRKYVWHNQKRKPKIKQKPEDLPHDISLNSYDPEKKLPDEKAQIFHHVVATL